ncbi:MAG: hypothetical protein HOI23_15250 [Deltaproteobacteria bacterium]|jgi:chemotaxis protein methyltransferase CheR|nr:hypothetical protein [Deltaproteobacteria bacterium]MBT6432666.1 hypothetical protein [Deltaproteobacteria bacterium]
MSILEPSDFTYIADLVMSKTGVLLQEAQHDFVRKRVLPIAREGGFDEIADLVDQLQMSPNSKLHSRVIEAVLEDETMFFRDFSSYKFLRHSVAKDLFGKRVDKKELNIWCAACSSGQEAYSISIMLKDALKQFEGWKINILATDISPTLIKKAKTGVFSQTEVNRGLPASLLLKHFDREGTIWKIHDEHTSGIQFEVFNLMNDWNELPVFDIILMRNILSYFPHDTQITIYDKLFEHMHPETYLFLSANEAPADGDRFFLLKSTEKDACYQLLPLETEDETEEQDEASAPAANETKASTKQPQEPEQPALKPKPQVAAKPAGEAKSQPAAQPAPKVKPQAAAQPAAQAKPQTSSKPAPAPAPPAPAPAPARVHEMDDIDDIEDLDGGLDDDDDMIEDV